MILHELGSKDCTSIKSENSNPGFLIYNESAHQIMFPDYAVSYIVQLYEISYVKCTFDMTP